MHSASKKVTGIPLTPTAVELLDHEIMFSGHAA